MDTLTEEPTLETDLDTPTTDTEETVDDDTSTEDDAATLQKRLTDKDRYIKDLEAQRKKSEKEKDKPVTKRELEESNWERDNGDRISLVKEEFEKIQVEGYEGEPVSKKIALELAEKLAKIDSSEAKRVRQNDMSVHSVTNRNANPEGYETEADRVLGLTIAKKRKLEERHPHLKQ